MLRNIIYNDKNIKIIIIASSSPLSAYLTTYVYDGPATKYKLLCEFTTSLSGVLLPVALVACWTLVREAGSVSDEMHASINKTIRHEMSEPTTKFREIDWTKQIPTELGSGDTN